MKYDKIKIREFIAKQVKAYLSEEEKAAEENPFAGKEEDSKEEKDSKEEDDKKKKPQSTEPAGIPIKFNLSAVKKYNDVGFVSDNGIVKKISKDGILVTVEPDGVDVLVNFDDISEQVKKFFKSTRKNYNLLKEEIQDKETASMNAAMQLGLQTLASEFKINREKIQGEADDAKTTVDEALGAVAVLGLILALPRVVELLVKGFGKITQVWKKLVKPGEAKGREVEVAQKIIEFTHKWHKLYIKGLHGLLKIAGVFKKAKINNEKAQLKVAEALYYTLIAGLAVYSGVGAVGAFKAALSNVATSGHFSIGALESAMASIKSQEVVNFLKKIQL